MTLFHVSEEPDLAGDIIESPLLARWRNASPERAAMAP
jgi:hypothetical protein